MKKYLDILKNNNKEEIILGYNNKSELIVNIFENSSIIITGETGTGKSTLLDQIIVQLINKYTSNEIGIISIDTSGVELNSYSDSKYGLYSAINDRNKSIVALSRVLKEIDRRKELFIDQNVMTFKEYNEVSSIKLPLLVVAIDDDKMFLNEPDVEKMISGIIHNINNYGILFILVTNNIYNKFFMKDNNLLSSILISYDLASFDDTLINNIDGSDELGIGKFMCKKDNVIKTYYNYKFEDEIINEII